MNDEVYMQRAFELARSAARTSPNPRVGAVVVRDGVVLGEGYHEGAGHPHAETLALESARSSRRSLESARSSRRSLESAAGDARGATLYVTLEPCSHQGRTPPCAPALVDAGLSRVVAAMEDPDERVTGRGLALLRSAGIEVDVGLGEAEARRINAPYLHHRSTGLPLVTIKLALTLDGRLGAPDGTSQWITAPEARALVHARRAEVDAVLVGAGTVLADDPSLTARDVGAARQPLRVVADARGAVPPTAKVVSGPGEVVYATTARCPHETQTALKEAGAEVLLLDESDEGIDLTGLMEDLGARGLLEVYCEGGGVLASSLLRAGLADRLELFYGPLVVGGGGPGLGDVGVDTLAEAFRWSASERRPIGDGFALTLESPRLTELLAPTTPESS